jgi:FkbM family methyltransferase
MAPAPARYAFRRTRLGRRLARAVENESQYEPEVRRALEVMVHAGWVCADIGAHHGIITRLLAHLVGPDGRVIAFEAHPENANELAERVAADGIRDRVRIENLAVTDGAARHVSLHPGRAHASAEWNVVGTDLDGRQTPAELKVPATSLDAYFPPGSHLDCVKIDVEGAEGEVLAGMRRLLRETRPAVVIEFHDEAGWRGRYELLDADYDLYAIGGTRIDPNRDVERHYQCFALPQERPLAGDQRDTLLQRTTS